MLESIDGDEVRDLPHRDEYNRRTERLRPGLAGEICQVIDAYCERHSGISAGRLFSADGFPEMHHALVTDLSSEDEANKLLGQIVWETLRGRGDRWLFYRPSSDGEIPPGMEYWRPRAGSSRER